jgi:hypothetical protein
MPLPPCWVCGQQGLKAMRAPQEDLGRVLASEENGRPGRLRLARGQAWQCRS